MKVVTLPQFQRKCSALLKLVNKTHKPIQVTRFGKPLAEIRPPGLSPKERAAREARDLDLLNKYADQMNVEAEGDFLFCVPDGYALRKMSGRMKKSRRRRK